MSARRHPLVAATLALTACLATAGLAGTSPAGAGGRDPRSTATTEPTDTTTDGSSSTTDRPSTTVRATTTTVAEPTEMPLTGRPLAPGERVPRRGTIVVKIDNAPGARPQTGVNLADIVFEEIVEGNITRFAALYHSQGADPVGPIRSGRTQDVDLLTWLHAPIFVWSGGNPGVTRAIDESDFVSVPDGTENFFRRSGGRRAPHNLYASTQPIWDYYLWSIYPPPSFFDFADPDERVPGKPTEFVELMMGGIPVRWDYDAETDQYTRSQLGRVHEVREGEEDAERPVTADNVVVLLSGYRPSPVDVRSPEAITVGDGIAYVLSDGTLQIGRWSRADSSATLTLETADGDPIEIGIGRTWVELANKDTHETETG